MLDYDPDADPDADTVILFNCAARFSCIACMERYLLYKSTFNWKVQKPFQSSTLTRNRFI